jgi:hypothetical protein
MDEEIKESLPDIRFVRAACASRETDELVRLADSALSADRAGTVARVGEHGALDQWKRRLQRMALRERRITDWRLSCRAR